MLVEKTVSKYPISLRSACKLFGISKQGYYYKSILKDLAYQYPKYGYWKLYHLMRNQGHVINHKRVHRLYKTLNLQMRKQTKKRLVGVITHPIMIPHKPNQIW